MLRAMRTLALDYLFQQLEGSHRPPYDLEEWYRNLRTASPGRLFPFLVESTENFDRVYVIQTCPESDCAEVVVQDMSPEVARHLPFLKQAPRSPQAGPIVKRSFTPGKGAGPVAKTLDSTLNTFQMTAAASKTWSPYFREIVKVLSHPVVKMTDGTVIDWQKEGYGSLLEAVVQKIPDTKGDVLITVRDDLGKLPGERQEYIRYLMEEKLAGEKYVTMKTQAFASAICPLCQTTGVTVFPNALKGAGLNFKNVDRDGTFPGLDRSAAWKSYALCASCADLLYIYKFHLLRKRGGKRDRVPFTANVAGQPALIVPFTTLDTSARQQMLWDVAHYIKNISEDVSEDEDNILDILKDEQALINMNFIWVDIGQEIQNIKGIITDVPPSRLRKLSDFNAAAATWQHPVFPREPIAGNRLGLAPDLALRALRALFRRPGGKKAQSENDSRRLFQLKRAVAAAVYHGTPIPTERLWHELMTTARCYYREALADDKGVWGLVLEGEGKKGPYLTAAGWIRSVAWWLHYFRCLEVMQMEHSCFDPEMESLKPYFGPETGIDTDAKAYAYLLGILYGKLLEVQGARGVNVGANALTWLKRLTLRGKDLPELYVKIRGKLLSYESEKSRKVRQLIEEIGHLGVKLGDRIDLDQTQTNYYLLLGQSLSRNVLKKDGAEEDSKGGNNE